MKKKLNYAGILVGILCLIFAFCTFGTGNTHYSKYETYGGDAYTGIQNAAADTANNVNDMADSVSIIGGYILLIAGLLIIIHFAKELCETQKNHNIDEVSSTTFSTSSVAPNIPASEGKDDTWVCSHCSTVNPASKGFCTNCGKQRS